MSAFSDWLGSTMTDRGLGLRQLATYVGVSHNTIRLWAQGASTPTWENCAKLARALRVDEDQVRRLAGYGDAPDPSAPGAVLSPEEERLLHAWRVGSAEGRRLLLVSAEAIAEMGRGAGSEAPVGPQRRQRRRGLA